MVAKIQEKKGHTGSKKACFCKMEVPFMNVTGTIFSKTYFNAHWIKIRDLVFTYCITQQNVSSTGDWSLAIHLTQVFSD